MQNARSIAVTALVTVVVIALLGAVFVFSGIYNVSAAREHSGIVAATLHEMAERSVATHARSLTSPPIDTAAALEGIAHFHEMCVVCHGAPGVAQDEIAEGLNPKAPELSRHSAREFSEGEIFWMVRNGIKFTAMPGFQKSHTDEQMWAIARFVKRLDGMTEAQYEATIRAVRDARGGVMEEENGMEHMHMGSGPESAHHE